MKLVHNSFTFAIEFEENIVNLIVVRTKVILDSSLRNFATLRKGARPVTF